MLDNSVKTPMSNSPGPDQELPNEKATEQSQPVVATYDPVLADHGEPEMEQRENGSWVAYHDYLDLLDEYNELVDEINALRSPQK